MSSHPHGQWGTHTVWRTTETCIYLCSINYAVKKLIQLRSSGHISHVATLHYLNCLKCLNLWDICARNSSFAIDVHVLNTSIPHGHLHDPWMKFDCFYFMAVNASFYHLSFKPSPVQRFPAASWNAHSHVLHYCHLEPVIVLSGLAPSHCSRWTGLDTFSASPNQVLVISRYSLLLFWLQAIEISSSSFLAVTHVASL